MSEFVYRCIECQRQYKITRDLMLCPECSPNQAPNEPLRGLLEVKIPTNLRKRLESRNAEWSPVDLLPVDRKYFPSIPVGDTPLWKPDRLCEKTGFPHLYVKNEGTNPTGSLKDRASYLVAAFAIQFGYKEIVLASTGNAGSSMAGIGAAAGLRVKLFLPKKTPEAKLTQALQYGADVVKIAGGYDAAFDQAIEWAKQHKCLCRNTAYHPMTVEGKKTAALEIYRQLDSRQPDYLFVSAGDGVILSGLYKGFEGLLSLGLINKIPHMVVVQSEGSQAINIACQKGGFDPEYKARTTADSIQVDIPRGGYFALKKIKEHAGQVITVSDRDILKAQKELAAEAGLFTEPAGAAGAAGFFKIRESLPRQASIVLLATGNGLKDIESAKKGLCLYE